MNVNDLCPFISIEFSDEDRKQLEQQISSSSLLLLLLQKIQIYRTTILKIIKMNHKQVKFVCLSSFQEGKNRQRPYFRFVKCLLRTEGNCALRKTRGLGSEEGNIDRIPVSLYYARRRQNVRLHRQHLDRCTQLSFSDQARFLARWIDIQSLHAISRFSQIKEELAV